MENLAIIPARGGSKRIPGKNIRSFLGKPIISYSIEIAKKSGLFDEIMVSTDSPEISDISKKYGASVPFLRSEKNSDDNATLSEVIEEVKMSYKKANMKFDLICCILPTAPLIKIEYFKACHSLLLEKGFDSVRPVVSYSYPIQRSFKMNDNRVEFMFPEYIKSRSQDLEKTYHDTGQFYWMKYLTGLKSDNRGAFEIPNLHAQDIDTEEDWKLAELKYKIINNI